MVKRVRGLAISTGVTIGLLALAVIAARRSNVGDTIIEGLRGFGSNVGQGITAPFTGLLEGVTQGGGALQQQALSTGADFQQALTGNRNAIGDFLAQFDPNRTQNAQQAGRPQALDLTALFARAERIGIPAGVTNPTGQVGGAQFGGFGSAAAQQQAFQDALEQSVQNNPEFFI